MTLGKGTAAFHLLGHAVPERRSPGPGAGGGGERLGRFEPVRKAGRGGGGLGGC